MTDIVERLRSGNGRMGVRDPNDYGMAITVAEANEAADEIEQLREALDQTAGFAMSLCLAEGREAADEIVWLRGERNRLAADLAKAHREALAWMDKAAARREQIEIIVEMFDRHYPYDDIAAEARALLTEGGR